MKFLQYSSKLAPVAFPPFRGGLTIPNSLPLLAYPPLGHNIAGLTTPTPSFKRRGPIPSNSPPSSPSNSPPFEGGGRGG